MKCSVCDILGVILFFYVFQKYAIQKETDCER